ncbi:MAG TPA: UDP-N-acetylmuramoyl-L-alanine--D-glutamate ligase [Anaerolineaceae bacterium]|nr:UDP-N-acetylmuramoyl-L-alanine--D-glutamate ligase [Anaerolineaceae bacterium]HPN51475.1 UDP-N-acetylmuramoyl-L-alanine--D-glutamate ligase [Anaerolineaceae bacterium]
MNWQDRKVLIIGAARQGLALARYLAGKGAQVRVNDQRTPEQLQAAVDSLAGCAVAWILGAHPFSALDGVDLVCLSGGVPLTLPIVVEAQRRGLALSNDSQIFMDLVPCPVIGITGSAGKTTTTTLVGRMTQAALALPRRAWIGGNIGLPLINDVDQMRADDLVVLELSSFQLEQMTRSPQVAAILNITPNHLDRHGTMEAYTAAKARLLAFQSAGDTAVLGRDDPGAWGLIEMVKGRLVSFGLRRPERGQVGTFEADGTLWLQGADGDVPLMPRNLIRLRGEHNLRNVLAACAVAAAAGLPVEAMRQAVEGFNGVAHRLEFVSRVNGADWYNDSIATAPERTAAAVHSFDEPLVLMLGGRDKKLPWEDLAALIHQRVDHVVLFGECAPKVQQALGQVEAGRRPYSVAVCANLHEAVQAAAAVAGPGDVVLLSPGGTSYDEFRDFEERGERFRLWVKELL